MIYVQEYEGELHFATDTWTSPNHHAYVAVTVHFVFKGHPLALPLDVVEVPRSHSGVNLAQAFAGILKEFDISDKVREISNSATVWPETLTDLIIGPWGHL